MPVVGSRDHGGRYASALIHRWSALTDPTTLEASSPGEPLPLEEDRDPGLPYRLLLVEDDRGDALLVEAAFEDALPDTEITWYPDIPTEAELATLEFDCVLLDLGLVGRTGLEALDAMVELVDDVPVIVLTGLDDRPTGLSALSHGAADFLVKGEHDAEALARAVRYAVQRAQAAATRVLWRESQLLRAENLRLERGLLPRPLIADERVVWRSRYLPGAGASVLGGDFFDTVERPDGSIRAMIGDVCGHGPDEAAIGVALRIAWRTMIMAGHPDDRVLHGLEAILEAERADRQFCTLLDITVSPDRRHLTTRVAGHPPGILLDLDGSQPASYLPTEHRDVPLGIGVEGTWNAATIELDGPWGLLVFTDGVYEPVVPDGGQLDLEGLIDIVRSDAPPASGDDLDRLLDLIRQPHLDAGHPDDLALVGLLVT